MDLLDDMINAAAKAAGANWSTVSNDLKVFSQNLLRDSAATAKSFSAGDISSEDVEVELHAIENEAVLIAGYEEQEAKQAAQDAINAAVKVLATAITSFI